MQAETVEGETHHGTDGRGRHASTPGFGQRPAGDLRGAHGQVQGDQLDLAEHLPGRRLAHRPRAALVARPPGEPVRDVGTGSLQRRLRPVPPPKDLGITS